MGALLPIGVGLMVPSLMNLGLQEPGTWMHWLAAGQTMIAVAMIMIGFLARRQGEKAEGR